MADLLYVRQTLFQVDDSFNHPATDQAAWVFASQIGGLTRRLDLYDRILPLVYAIDGALIRAAGDRLSVAARLAEILTPAKLAKLDHLLSE